MFPCAVVLYSDSLFFGGNNLELPFLFVEPPSCKNVQSYAFGKVHVMGSLACIIFFFFNGIPQIPICSINTDSLSSELSMTIPYLLYFSEILYSLLYRMFVFFIVASSLHIFPI